jgi:foldase protein PrsA
MKNILNKVKAFFKVLKNKVTNCKLCKNIKLPKIKISTKWFKENKILSIGFIAVLIAFIFGYFLKGYFVAALVNGKPISRLRVIRELEKKQGLSALDNIITEELIRQEAKKKGLSVSKAEVDAEMASIETSLKSQSQTLDQILAAQGMTRSDLIKNIELQKLIEKILTDKVTVSDAEVQKYIDDNKASFPEGTNMDEVKTLVKQQLIQQKVSTEFQTWLDSVKKTAKINILVKY